MTCEDCATAAVTQHHGFTAGCAGCCARAASRSPHFDRVRKLGRLDSGYRMLLDEFRLTHDQVKAASAADAIDHQPKEKA